MLKLKKCNKCKMHKENKYNYQRTPAGKYSKNCNDCRIVVVGELKCLPCKKHKSKKEFKEKSYKFN